MKSRNEQPANNMQGSVSPSYTIGRTIVHEIISDNAQKYTHSFMLFAISECFCLRHTIIDKINAELMTKVTGCYLRWETTSRCYGDDDDKQHVYRALLRNGHVARCHVVRGACWEDWTMTSSSFDTVTLPGATLLTPVETAAYK